MSFQPKAQAVSRLLPSNARLLISRHCGTVAIVFLGKCRGGCAQSCAPRLSLGISEYISTPTRFKMIALCIMYYNILIYTDPYPRKPFCDVSSPRFSRCVVWMAALNTGHSYTRNQTEQQTPIQTMVKQVAATHQPMLHVCIESSWSR